MLFALIFVFQEALNNVFVVLNIVAQQKMSPCIHCGLFSKLYIFVALLCFCAGLFMCEKKQRTELKKGHARMS